MNIAKNLTELIGHTPLVELGGYSRRYGLPRPLVAKVEAFNPGGSVKARTALALIDDAERRGLLRPGATIRGDHHRAYERQHRHRPCPGGRHPRLPPDTDHARDHEP